MFFNYLGPTAVQHSLFLSTLRAQPPTPSVLTPPASSRPCAYRAWKDEVNNNRGELESLDALADRLRLLLNRPRLPLSHSCSRMIKHEDGEEHSTCRWRAGCVAPVPKATNMIIVFCSPQSSLPATYNQLSHIHQAAAQLRNINSLQQYQIYLSTHQVAIDYAPVIASYS